jgi:hypothetical protein
MLEWLHKIEKKKPIQHCYKKHLINTLRTGLRLEDFLSHLHAVILEDFLMLAIHHFLIIKNKIHHLDTVNISELQSEHPCGCMPSHTFVDLLCTQIRNQNRIWIWIRTRSQGVCDTWLKWALIIIWGCAMVPLLSLLLVIAPAFRRLNFTVNVPICFIPHKNCSYLLLGGLICITFYYQGTEETRSNQQTTYCTVWNLNPCSAHDYHLKPTTTIVDGSRHDCIFVKSYA